MAILLIETVDVTTYLTDKVTVKKTVGYRSFRTIIDPFMLLAYDIQANRPLHLLGDCQCGLVR